MGVSNDPYGMIKNQIEHFFNLFRWSACQCLGSEKVQEKRFYTNLVCLALKLSFLTHT